MVAIQLTIAKGAQAGAQALFEQPEVLIGRTEDNDVVLLQGGVSRRHARVYVDGSGAWAEDLGSANGTLVNGKRLEQPRRLREGDEITVGAVVLMVSLPDDGAGPEVSNTHILGDDVDEPSETSGAGDRDEEFSEATAPLPPAAPLGPLPRARRAPAREPEKLSEVSEVSDAGPGEGTVPVDADEVAEAIDAAATRLNPIGTPSAPRRGAGPEAKAPVAKAPVPKAPVAAEALESAATRLNPIVPAPAAVAPAAVGLEIERAQTRMLELPLEARAADVKRKLRSIDAGQLESQGASALARAAPRDELRVLSAAASSPVREVRGNLAKMDAVDRVRLRRELSDTMGGQLRLWWLDLEQGARRLTLAALLLVTLGIVATLWFVFRPAGGADRGPTGPEPVALGSVPAAGTFGWGEGVTWPNREQKTFSFEFVSPTRVVAVLHFEAADISQDEVVITLNGIDLGSVEADTASVRDREHEWVLPLLQLRSGEPNQVIFDNRNNPPGSETWRIKDPWVEIIPVPELSDRQLVVAAREHAARGSALIDKREVGADNLFKAWKAYREAWITLEPLSEHPPLYHDVRLRMNQLKAEMDTLCGTLLLDFQRAIELNQRRKAKVALQDVMRHFPTPEHRCHNQALARYNEYSL